MKRWTRDSMSLGQIFGFAMLVYRKHFLLMFAITVLFYGVPSLLYFLSVHSPGNAMVSLLYGIFNVFAFPLSMAMVLFVIHDVREGKTPGFKKAFRQTSQRIWILVRSSILYYLIMIGFALLGIAIMVGSTADSEKIDMMAVLFALPVFALIAFFAIRFGFFLPEVAFERRGLGLKGSWRITAHHFWRLLGIYFTVLLMTCVVSIAFIFVLALFYSDDSVLVMLLIEVAVDLFIPFVFVIFSVVYFDLKVRNEETSLHENIEAEGASSEMG